MSVRASRSINTNRTLIAVQNVQQFGRNAIKSFLFLYSTASSEKLSMAFLFEDPKPVVLKKCELEYRGTSKIMALFTLSARRPGLKNEDILNANSAKSKELPTETLMKDHAGEF